MTSPAPRPATSPAAERTIRLPAQAREAMLRHSMNCAPEEACGLIAVDGEGAIRMVYPLTNARHSPQAFTVEPRQHFGALTHAERHGWVLGGVFHSHPTGPALLSATDLEQPHDPDWFHLVVGLSPSVALRAYVIISGRAEEIRIV